MPQLCRTQVHFGEAETATASVNPAGETNFKDFYFLTPNQFLIWRASRGRVTYRMKVRNPTKERYCLLLVGYCYLLCRGLCKRRPKTPLAMQNYPARRRMAPACLSCQQTTQQPGSGPVKPTCCFIHQERTGQNKRSSHCIPWLRLGGCFNR